jgi:hypothetical protein
MHIYYVLKARYEGLNRDTTLIHIIKIILAVRSIILMDKIQRFYVQEYVL